MGFYASRTTGLLAGMNFSNSFRSDNGTIFLFARHKFAATEDDGFLRVYNWSVGSMAS